MDFKTHIQAVKKECLLALKKVDSVDSLKEVEQRFFSRKNGELSKAMKLLKDESGQAKQTLGQMANDIKKELEDAFANKHDELRREQMAAIGEREAIDVTQTLVTAQMPGHIHPLTQGLWELEDVARGMGFIVEDGPELDSDFYVFESLNIPAHHPARDSQDTFYIKDHPNWCMRSHVSNMQVRLMRKYSEKGSKPVRAAYPGRVFRNEAIDATHEHTFYQFEALMVDREIHIGHLVGVIKELLKGLFGREIEVRLRPSYFPFVEPGFELDMKVDFGKGEQWVEMLGCGLMHPRVLEEGGYDPHEWQGLAFGMGLNRLVMAKYGIEDIRHFHSGDMRFLEQF
ncbi:MAG: phenylalanine--tRNA ligase subunit alpha [Candidatus Magasanikbacteria bacterium CG10_big_fil_rev_8_21_14_0_10_47_10]|uniref:Phenylalanine--tRNA ligase alpha subunit n=1 Tax=Candidatus Magasanikbacteria bacterium CG10_big_fil_rev_8_21_14_0_10_47_10 TaxID=1974652 RepID=A0A2H0TQM4_9BACT|nr:MAG: phenylalanine--tRNA ligase subunit alpha [Candidatus Magasanikbacteria bacterium CG10_big_fil_rev_8_21_14_0_10_47_10]